MINGVEWVHIGPVGRVGIWFAFDHRPKKIPEYFFRYGGVYDEEV